MQKIWVGLVAAFSIYFVGCGGTSGGSAQGPGVQAKAYTKVCLQRPSPNQDIRGMIWSVPFGDEGLSGQSSWLFDDSSVTMTAACTSKSNPTSTTKVSLKASIKLAPNQIQFLEAKQEDQSVAGGVCRLTTTPQTLSYYFQGSCLRVNYPNGDSVVLVPNPTPAPSPSLSTLPAQTQPVPRSSTAPANP